MTSTEELGSQLDEKLIVSNGDANHATIPATCDANHATIPATCDANHATKPATCDADGDKSPSCDEKKEIVPADFQLDSMRAFFESW